MRLYMYDENEAEFKEVKNNKKDNKKNWLYLVILFIGILEVLYTPIVIKQWYLNQRLSKGIDIMYEHSLRATQQAIDANKRQIDFYRAIGLEISIEDSLKFVKSIDYDSIEVLKDKDFFKEAEVITRHISALDDSIRNAKLKLDYIPAVIPIDIEDVIIQDSATGKLRVSLFGQRMHPILNEIRMHNGIDFAIPEGTPVYATGAGVVTFAGRSTSGHGIQVHINHNKQYMTTYSHLSQVAVKKGDKVKRDDFIGLSGNTGLSTGPHLHYEVLTKPPHSEAFTHVDPLNFMMWLITDAKLKESLESGLGAFEKF